MDTTPLQNDVTISDQTAEPDCRLFMKIKTTTGSLESHANNGPSIRYIAYREAVNILRDRNCTGVDDFIRPILIPSATFIPAEFGFLLIMKPIVRAALYGRGTFQAKSSDGISYELTPMLISVSMRHANVHSTVSYFPTMPRVPR